MEKSQSSIIENINIKEQKSMIRNEILKKRRMLTESFVYSSSSHIINNLRQIIDKKNYDNIMIFMDMENEVQITRLIDLYPQKRFFIPKTFPDREMKINIYNKDELMKHRFGYYESLSAIFYDEGTLDMVIVPAVAFDYERNRIGFGGGYYDKFLARIVQNKKGNHDRPLIMGVCYDFQLLASIPSEGHDIKPDIIITESQIIEP